jgi:hypothetical protein
MWYSVKEKYHLSYTKACYRLTCEIKEKILISVLKVRVELLLEPYYLKLKLRNSMHALVKERYFAAVNRTRLVKTSFKSCPEKINFS